MRYNVSKRHRASRNKNSSDEKQNREREKMKMKILPSRRLHKTPSQSARVSISRSCGRRSLLVESWTYDVGLLHKRAKVRKEEDKTVSVSAQLKCKARNRGDRNTFQFVQ